MWPQLALLAVGLIWGSANIFVKSASGQIPPAFLIALRCTAASALLALIFRKRLRGLTCKDFLSGAIIGICMFSAYYIQTCSMRISDPGKCGFLASVYCVIVPFLYWIVVRKRPTWRHLLAAVLCLAGVVFCSVTETLSISWGDSMALLSGFFYAAHIVSVEKCSKGRDPIAMTILQFGFTAVFAWVVALATERQQFALPASALFDVAYLAFISTGLATLLQNLGQKRVNSNLASILMSTESVFTLLISVSLGMERLTVQICVGFVLIFAAILISQIEPAEKKNTEITQKHRAA